MDKNQNRHDLACPECHHRLVYEDSFDPDTGKRDNAWYECSNGDCEYRCGADSLDVGQPTPARGYDEAPTKLPLVAAALPAALLYARDYLKECSDLLDGPDEWANPESGVGSVVAALDAALAVNGLLSNGRHLETASERKCLKCGCTDDCACDVTPGPGEAAATCSWVCESVDICSACLPEHLTPLFDEIRLLEGMMESAGIVLSARVDAAHAILKGEAK
jgi:hypothetical protein